MTPDTKFNHGDTLVETPWGSGSLFPGDSGFVLLAPSPVVFAPPPAPVVFEPPPAPVVFEPPLAPPVPTPIPRAPSFVPLETFFPQESHEAPRRKHWTRRFLVSPATLCLFVTACAGATRLAIPNAYDIFGDEIYYTNLSTSVRQGHYPPHFAHQGVFLLHPPLFFLIGALWEVAVHPGGGYIALISSLRMLVAICGVITAALLFGIGYQLKGRLAGVAAALIFAVDPYVLRTNGRVLLETTSVMFVAAGLFVLVRLTDGSSARPLDTAGYEHRHTWVVALAGGLLMGLGVVTDELAAMITIFPLATVWILGWSLRRRVSFVALLGSLVPYAGYLVSLQVTHNLGAFVEQDSLGLSRALGSVRDSGFSAPNAPSLSHEIVGQIWQFGPTYVLIALAVLSSAYLVIFTTDGLRLLGVVGVFATLAVGYEVAFSSVEEQFLYVLIVPGFAAVTCAACDVVGRVGRRRRAGFGDFLRVLLCLVCLYDFGMFALVRGQSDNGLEQLVTYFRGVPARGTVATNVFVASSVLQQSGVPSLDIAAPAEYRKLHIRYVAVLSAELQGTYGVMSPNQALWFEQHGRLVFSTIEATYGTIEVFETENPALW